MNPINQELNNYKRAIVHYERILREDAAIKKGEIEANERPLLTDKDINKINLKLKGLREQRDHLLKQDNDYVEVL
ncbi:hypothetical protein [Methanobrevibacter sp.]|jgi:hypothetical protein|uniref:hypothetical protein n=1 Tax=Methanobrevibacter sp. TaxID=66852 RepID=UPI00386732D9